MTRHASNHNSNPESDQQKAHTPDRLRNDRAKWKEPDQPDDPEAGKRRNPERDYPQVPAGERDRRP